jgi:hypothetical protein
VLVEQAKTQAKQQFEDTFFSLLEQHNKALEKLTAPTNSWINNNRSHMDMIRSAVLSTDVEDLASGIAGVEIYNGICGHYFRVLYQLLKFVATNCPSGEIGQQFEADKIKNSLLCAEEKMYSNIVRSFLGYDVTQLLSINCFCPTPGDTYWKYKLLIERYSFLEHMPFVINGENNSLLNESISYYEPVAFGKSNFVKL